MKHEGLSLWKLSRCNQELRRTVSRLLQEQGIQGLDWLMMQGIEASDSDAGH